MQLGRLPQDSWRKTNLSHHISCYHNVIFAALLDTVRHFSRVKYTNMASELLRDDDLQFDYEKQHFGDYQWQRENLRSTSTTAREKQDTL